MNTSRFWVPADEAPYPKKGEINTFQGLKTPTRSEFAESRELPAAERRLLPVLAT